MNERSFIVKSFDKTILTPGFFPRAQSASAGLVPASCKPHRPLAKALSFKPRAVLAPLGGIRDFVRLCRQRRWHPLWLLDKLPDRQDRTYTQERVNRRFHDASTLFL